MIWEDMVVAHVRVEVAEAVPVVQEAVHVVVVLEPEHQLNRLKVVIIGLIMTDVEDYILATQTARLLVQNQAGIQQ